MIDRKISELFGDLGIKMCDKRRSEQIFVLYAFPELYLQNKKWQKYKDKIFVFAGKWEDGINENVLGDTLAIYDAKEFI